MNYDDKCGIVFILVFLMIIVQAIRVRRARRLLSVLFSRNNGLGPTLHKLNVAIRSFNKEFLWIAFGAEECASMTFREHRITIARGRIGYVGVNQYGSHCSFDDRFFVVCSSDDASWASTQRDVFHEVGVGSEIAIYWVKNILKIVRETKLGKKDRENCPQADK